MVIVPYEGMETRQWIKARMKVLGITQIDIAEALGLPPPRISELISRARSIQVEEIVPFAKIMKMSERDVVLMFSSNKSLLTDAPMPHFNTSIIKIVGQVAAGLFMDADAEYTDPDGYVPVSSSAVPNGKNYFALRIRGDSMDKLLADGDIVICVPVAEYDRDIVTGSLVVVDRSVNGLVESTIKQFERREDGSEYLWPRSNNPAHQSPIRFDNIDTQYDDGGLPPVAIRAIVTFSMKQHG